MRGFLDGRGINRAFLVFVLGFSVLTLFFVRRSMRLTKQTAVQVRQLVGNPGSSAPQKTLWQRVDWCDPVDLFLPQIYQRFGIPKKGIIHVGAHVGQELPIYKQQAIPSVLWIEPNPAVHRDLIHNTKDHPQSQLFFFAASDKDGRTILNTPIKSPHTTLGSLLPMGSIQGMFGVDQGQVEVPTKRLDTFFADRSDRCDYNVLVMDVQGGEPLVLAGATETLKHIDAVITEVTYSSKDYYQGITTIQDFDALMAKHGFVRVDTISSRFPYDGDALYVRPKYTTVPKSA